MDPQNLMTTLQQLSSLSGTNLSSQMALNQFGGSGNELSSLPWTASPQSWLDSAKMAAMYNIIQTASVNSHVQQLNNINAMNSFEQSLKLLTQQTNAAPLPQFQPNMDQLAAAQSTLQNRLAMESMLQNDSFSTILQNNLQQQQVSTANTSTEKDINTNFARLLQLPHNTDTAELITNNLQNIIGLASATSSTFNKPPATNTAEPNVFNAAANHQSDVQNPCDLSQNACAKATKRPMTDCAQPQPTSSKLSTDTCETSDQGALFSQLNQNNLLAFNSSGQEHNYLPSTSVGAMTQQSSSTTATGKLNGLTIDDFDLSDFREIFADKKQKNPKPSEELIPMAFPSYQQHEPQPTTSVDIQQAQQKPSIDSNLDLDHLDSMVVNNEFDFDFNETAEHIEKSFDPLKFLKEMTGDAARDSPEPTFNQAELEPVQFTPPDSPQQQTLFKMDNLASDFVSTSHIQKPSSKFGQLDALKMSVQGVFDLSDQQPSTSKEDFQKSAKNALFDMPLVFIPLVKETTKKSSEQAVRKSTLLRNANKVPIYKQKFVNLTNNVPKLKGEDCYSFIDDEFDLVTSPDPSISAAQKDHETSAITSRTTEKTEKTQTSTGTTARRIPQIKESREFKSYVGVPWSKEFLERMERTPLWVCVNPFEYADIETCEPTSDLAWTADRSTFKNNPLRVVIKEEPAPTADVSKEAPRPRLVLKFIKPKSEDVTNYEPPASTSYEDRHSKKSKHKKHKKKERDEDWEYPGQPKRCKKEKKHRQHHKHHHQHRSKSELEGSDEKAHPVYNTRSGLSIKTEQQNHTSLTDSNYSPASSKQEPTNQSMQHRSSTSNDFPLILNGRLMDDQFAKRYRSFKQTQSDLTKGTFVVAKEDVWQEDCPLWRIDSQNLLKKFVLCHENPGCYTNTSNYTGWCDEIADNYVIIEVEKLKQTRAETIVRPLHPLNTLFPALCAEDSSIWCVEKEQTEDLDDNSPTKSDQALLIESVIELLLKQCADPSTLAEAHKSDSKSARALNEFRRQCERCIDEVQIEEMIRMDLWILLDRYHGLVTFACINEDGDECLACGQADNLIRVGLYGDEKYDPDLLAVQSTTDLSDTFAHSMDIVVCRQCAKQLKFYHCNRHGLYHLFKECEDQFINLAIERPTATAHVLLNLALKNRNFIQTATDRVLQLWNQLLTIKQNCRLAQSM